MGFTANEVWGTTPPGVQIPPSPRLAPVLGPGPFAFPEQIGADPVRWPDASRPPPGADGWMDPCRATRNLTRSSSAAATTAWPRPRTWPRPGGTYWSWRSWSTPAAPRCQRTRSTASTPASRATRTWSASCPGRSSRTSACASNWRGGAIPPTPPTPRTAAGPCWWTTRTRPPPRRPSPPSALPTASSAPSPGSTPPAGSSRRPSGPP